MVRVIKKKTVVGIARYLTEIILFLFFFELLFYKTLRKCWPLFFSMVLLDLIFYHPGYWRLKLFNYLIMPDTNIIS